MPSIYEEGRALAIRMLAPEGSNPDAAGQVVTLSYVIPGAYDPEAQGYAPDVTIVQEVSGVELMVKAERVNGSTILTGDSILNLSPVKTDGADVDVPPQAAATATVTFSSGAVKMVVAVAPKAPSGLLLALELQLRGA